jgi:hypothetical protein
MRIPPASDTGRSKAIDGDEITLDALERRQRLERANRAFADKLQIAILNGLETPAGVLGHEHGPHSLRRSR